MSDSEVQDWDLLFNAVQSRLRRAAAAAAGATGAPGADNGDAARTAHALAQVVLECSDALDRLQALRSRELRADGPACEPGPMTGRPGAGHETDRIVGDGHDPSAFEHR